MTFQTTSWLLPSAMVVLLSTCGDSSHRDHAEASTAPAGRDGIGAEEGDRSRASKEVLEEHGPGAMKEGKRIRAEPPEEEPTD